MEKVVDVQTVGKAKGQAPASQTHASGGAKGEGRYFITREDRREYLANLAACLNTLTARFARMLHGVSDAEMRAVFVEEKPAVAKPLPDPAHSTGSGQAGRPRGREHPLITLVKLAIGTVRLQMRVLKTEADEAGEPADSAAAGELQGFVDHLKGRAKDLGIDPEAA